MRPEHLQEVNALAIKTLAGSGTVLIVGAPNTGKTGVLRSLTAQCHDAGLTTDMITLSSSVTDSQLSTMCSLDATAVLAVDDMHFPEVNPTPLLMINDDGRSLIATVEAIDARHALALLEDHAIAHGLGSRSSSRLIASHVDLVITCTRVADRPEIARVDLRSAGELMPIYTRTASGGGHLTVPTPQGGGR